MQYASHRVNCGGNSREEDCGRSAFQASGGGRAAAMMAVVARGQVSGNDGERVAGKKAVSIAVRPD